MTTLYDIQTKYHFNSDMMADILELFNQNPSQEQFIAQLGTYLEVDEEGSTMDYNDLGDIWKMLQDSEAMKENTTIKEGDRMNEGRYKPSVTDLRDATEDWSNIKADNSEVLAKLREFDEQMNSPEMEDTSYAHHWNNIFDIFHHQDLGEFDDYELFEAEREMQFILREMENPTILTPVDDEGNETGEPDFRIFPENINEDYDLLPNSLRNKFAKLSDVVHIFKGNTLDEIELNGTPKGNWEVVEKDTGKSLGTIGGDLVTGEMFNYMPSLRGIGDLRNDLDYYGESRKHPRKRMNESSADLMRIKNWLDEMRIKNYTINRDLSVDVDGEVDLIDVGLTEIPVQFGVVTGSFWCSENKLTSLEGAPREVGKSFYCSENKLTSLQGAPREVGGNFDCKDNPIAFKMTPNDVRKYLRQNGTILDKGSQIVTNLTNKGKNISTIQKERELRGAKTRLSNRQSRYDSTKREIEDLNAELYGDQERYSYETYGESKKKFSNLNESFMDFGEDDENFDWDEDGEVYDPDKHESDVDLDMVDTKRRNKKPVEKEITEEREDETPPHNNHHLTGQKVIVTIPQYELGLKTGQVITIDYVEGNNAVYTKGRDQYAIPTGNVKLLATESNIDPNTSLENKRIAKTYLKYMTEGRTHQQVTHAMSKHYGNTQEDIEFILSEALGQERDAEDYNQFYYNAATGSKNFRTLPVNTPDEFDDDYQTNPDLVDDPYSQYDWSGKKIIRSKLDGEIISEESESDEILEEIADEVLVDLIKDSSYKDAYNTIEDAVRAVILNLELEEELGEDGTEKVIEIIKQKYAENPGSENNYEFDDDDYGFEDSIDETVTEVISEGQIDQTIVQNVKKKVGHPREWVHTNEHYIARFYDKPFGENLIFEMRKNMGSFDKIKEEGNYTLLFFKK